MAYVPVDVPAFGGLDLRDPEDASGSPDLLNVISNRGGTLSSRPGLVLSGSTNLGTSPTGLAVHEYAGRTTPTVIAGYDGALRAYNGTSGAALASSYTTSDNSIWSFANIGGYTMIAGLKYTAFNDGTTIYSSKWVRAVLTGTRYGSVTAITFSQPTVSTKEIGASTFTAGRSAPYPAVVATQPGDNRLAWSGPPASWGSAGVSGESTVVFSQPDEPLKYDETDYVTLEKDDGERITAMASWADFLFVFKQTKFFVFYGNSTDSDGGAVFNYRTVRGLEDGGVMYQGQVVVADDGVYYINENGVYRTTGGAPQRVSDAVDWLFNGEAAASSRWLQPYPAGQGFAANGHVLFPVTLANSVGTLTYNYWLVLKDGQWWLWKFGEYVRAGAWVYENAQFPRSNAVGVFKMGLNNSTGFTTDNGTAFSSYYSSPYSAFGSPGVEKTVRQTELHGSGTVDLSWGKDLQSHGYAKSVTMLNGRGLDRTAVRGESLSWKVSSTSGWRLDRVIPFLREQRVTGVKS